MTQTVTFINGTPSARRQTPNENVQRERDLQSLMIQRLQRSDMVRPFNTLLLFLFDGWWNFTVGVEQIVHQGKCTICSTPIIIKWNRSRARPREGSSESRPLIQRSLRLGRIRPDSIALQRHHIAPPPLNNSFRETQHSPWHNDLFADTGTSIRYSTERRLSTSQSFGLTANWQAWLQMSQWPLSKAYQFRMWGMSLK